MGNFYAKKVKYTNFDSTAARRIPFEIIHFPLDVFKLNKFINVYHQFSNQHFTVVQINSKVTHPFKGGLSIAQSIKKVMLNHVFFNVFLQWK
jgi:hypothetical protein